MTAVSKQLKQSIIWRGFYFITLLLVNIVISRVLKADGAGIIFYLSNIFSFGVLIFSANLDGGFTYFASSKSITHNKLAGLAIVWTAIVSMIAFLVLPLYFRNFDTELVKYFHGIPEFGFYYILGILLINFFTALFYSKGNFFIPNIILGVSNLFLIGLIYFGIFTGSDFETIMHDYFQFLILQGVLLLIAFYWNYHLIPKIDLPNSSEFKELITYSSISLLGNFLFFFVYRIDYWFVKEWCNNSGDLGNYIQASKLSQMLLILPQILASSIFPQMASGEHNNQIVHSISKLFRIFSILFLILFAILLVIGKWLFPFVFGTSFSTMYLPMLILIPGIFCLCCSTLLSAYFSGKKQNQINLYAAAFALMIMI
jgi:O-antigen/teichoic acid export membrane protein